MTVQSWWSRWPERVEWEKRRLEERGFPYAWHDPDDNGIVSVDLTATVDATEYQLHAQFPGTYPYLRPVVARGDHDERFAFHQDPFRGILCLAARDAEFWDPTISLADFVAEQLPLVVAANAPGDARDALVEERVAEPIREAYEYSTGDTVLVDSAWTMPSEVDHGWVTLGVLRGGSAVTAVVVAVTDDAGRPVAAADGRICSLFDSGALVKGRWVRLAGPVLEPDAAGIFGAVVDDHAQFIKKPRWQPVGQRQLDFVAVVYNDEIAYGTYGDDWVVLIRERSRTTANHGGQVKLGRTYRAGPTDLAVRVPELRVLRDKKVALFGLGALGAPMALSYARAGVGVLAALDGDVVDPGTVARWPLGLAVSGAPKAQVLHDIIRTNFPLTTVVARAWRLGDVVDADGTTDIEVLNAMMDGAHIVVDATANLNVNQLLSDAAWEAGIPYIGVTATSGAWGGLVVSLRPGETLCRDCVLARLGPHDIALPPASPHGHAAPTACSETTFTGAGFDLTPLADEAVRTTVSLLSGGAEGAYPSVSWDLARLALRTEDGVLLPPTWSTCALPASPAGCARCKV